MKSSGSDVFMGPDTLRLDSAYIYGAAVDIPAADCALTSCMFLHQEMYALRHV
jgi:hypothetical protein